ncbi:sigma factor-like helix-turn-helix DNA-binding protein [Peribacillus loiseleuriae]|uniref:sigma factor-like helix-turn-helix DNA-binding protein n=1 Tax=Peribacillus loiseleuriae TaxID=1679170 RepID=UPI003D009D13
MDTMLEKIKHLYYEEKLSTRQVAKQLNISPQTVKSRLKNELEGARSPKEGTILRSSQEYSGKIRVTQLGSKNSSAKLIEETVLRIRAEYEQALQDGKQKSATQHYLAKKYNVKRPTMSDIVLYKTWKHI